MYFKIFLESMILGLVFSFFILQEFFSTGKYLFNLNFFSLAFTNYIFGPFVAIVVVLVWELDLPLPVQSVPITL